MGATLSSVFTRLFGKEQIQISMVGQPDAGKTTILNKLKPGEIITTMPTIGFDVETVKYKNIAFTVWDIRVHRRWWRNYFKDTQGIIFVVDSNDREMIADAKSDIHELHEMLQKDKLIDVVLLVFANKQDLPNAMTVSDLTDKLGLNLLHERKWHIQSTCATQGDGLYEGLDWLSKELAK